MHAAIFGPTMCGKTTLAKELCADFERRGIRTIVLDPYDAEWPCTFQTRKIGEFLKTAKTSRCCALFADEAGQLDLRDPEHEWILTGARHFGHVCHISGQTGVQLTPLGRSSVTRLFLFRSTEETAEYWRTAFVDDRIRGATTLKQYEFLHAQMFGDVKRMRLPAPK